jgi:hypothetical protein
LALVFFSVTTGLGSRLRLPLLTVLLLAAAGSSVPETGRGRTDDLLRMTRRGDCRGWREAGAALELDDVTPREEPTTLEGGARPGVEGRE